MPKKEGEATKELDILLSEWIKKTEEENRARLKQKLAEQGRNPFLQLGVGENHLVLHPEIPKDRESTFGKPQGIFKVSYLGDKDIYDWGITKTSPMYIKIARLLGKAPVEICVIRTGQGRSTRIDLK